LTTRVSPQLNIRLDTARRDILEAAAFVHSTTATKLVQQLVESAIEDYSRHANVQAALQARVDQVAVDDGKVAQLRTVRHGPALHALVWVEPEFRHRLPRRLLKSV
jgi:hypothetical protein